MASIPEGAVMKIICTKAEKENLLDCVASSPFCPLGNWNCSSDADRCALCFEDFEEWDVVDEDE